MARPRIRALPLGTGTGLTAAYAFVSDFTGATGSTAPPRPLTGR